MFKGGGKLIQRAAGEGSSGLKKVAETNWVDGDTHVHNCFTLQGLYILRTVFFSSGWIGHATRSWNILTGLNSVSLRCS